MKLKISNLNITPSGIPEECCIFKITTEVANWIAFHKLSYTVHPKGYYNIKLPEDINSWDILFEDSKSTTYLDGFSPNLNKNLHLGHLTNLIYASALRKLGGFTSIAILNETDNHPDRWKFESVFDLACTKFNYPVDKKYYSSDMLDNISEGYISEEEEYKGCRVVKFPKSGIKVIVKSDGSSSYIGQDLGLVNILNGDCTYLTGTEQKSHFEMIKELYPTIKHIPLGLLTLGDKKMSSRDGNVIYLKDLLETYTVNELKDSVLSYNIKTFKKGLKIKEGLSAQLTDINVTEFEDRKLNLVHRIAKNTLNPSFLYNYLKNSSVRDVNRGLRLLGYTN